MKDFPSKYDQAAVETGWRKAWASDDAFRWDASLPAELDYVIDTPPPTVSGTLHVGHVYSYTQADIMARFMRMSGRNVLYPIGWDDNGLPTERLVEKVKKVRGGTMSREEFVALCREVIPQYEDQFRDLFGRLALSVDWSREYQTISDESRTISQMSFLDLYKKGLLERRLEPTLWDPADRTAIAQAEVDEIEREGTLNEVAFAIEGGGEAIIATTRPELIGGCGALMIHPDHPRAGELVGKRAISPLYGVPVPIIADAKVDPEKGTGIVMCCTFGDVTDIHWWRTHGLPLRLVIDQAGKMKESLPLGSAEWPSVDAEAAHAVVEALQGLKVEKAREAVLAMLAERGVLRERHKTRQVVPVAERSGAPLEIIVTPQWFIRTLDFKDQLIEKGRELVWRPDYMRQRYESWVEGLKWDWSISRQRHFGVPLPVWYSRRPGEEGTIIVPTAAELPVDPSRDLPAGYTADEVIPEMDVMDTWATSSVTPQFVSRTISDEFSLDEGAHKRLFPMAMRPQAHEIIRTWAFYTIVKALHHQGELPWKSISISGWCLASDGAKMSKSKGNVIDPIKLLDEYGTDAVRYWTGTSRLGNDTVLAPNTLKQGKRLVTKLWNAARLAHLPLAANPITPSTARADIEAGVIAHPLDRWLLGELAATIEAATVAFEAYEYAQALREIEGFFWKTYCDNYLELVKRRTRFEGAPDAEQVSALHTLHHATTTLIRLFSPFLPYVCETLADLFRGEGDGFATVHARGNWPLAADYPEAGLDGETGALVLEIVGGVRKAKSDLGVSLVAPVERLVVSPAGEGTSLGALRDAVEAARADIEELAKAPGVTVEESAPADLASALSPDERVRVSLTLGPAPVQA
ncbi:valine--tRNA ligase [Mangrovibrevibacter kandeliae]|uniref:valine--tRNA ligase n=1 Tax=Mangrovibrevibacter kandeliae TaxID=2968473 RepID=UPI00211738BA|nr:valine--tRNA ligase [Aurantimonas sp. CSK15Z-1]MCQ8783638.1 valine--tRNA ligase [Aurantimonas sp. CSK15Z-1]